MGREHWEDVYARVGVAQVSWYQPDAATSMALIGRCGAVSSVVDVGGGASVLVDRLLVAGVPDLTVVDIAGTGMSAARERLGERAAGVEWVVHDVLTWHPARTFDVWHDRAAFHFLTTDAQRDAYRAVLAAALRPGGHVVIGTFAVAGPTHCSGLPVSRYDPDELAAQFPTLREVARLPEEHHTPGGAVQPFTWLLAGRPADQP